MPHRRKSRSISRGAQRSQSKSRSQQRTQQRATQQREQRANVREQARSAPARAAQRAAKARAAAPSYLAGLQAAGGLSGTQGAGAGQANRLANEYGQKGTSDARKKEITKELKGVRSQLNIDNRKKAYDSLNLGKTNKGLVMRTTDGSIVRDSSGNPIMSSAGKDKFDQTRQGYSDRSEYLRQTNPELYRKMYPVSDAAMNLLPKIMQTVIPGGSILSGIGSALRDKTAGATTKIKSGIGSIFDRFQNDQGSTARPAMDPQGGGGGGGGGIPKGGLPQAETSWAGIYNRLLGQGLSSEQAKQRMSEMGQSGGFQTFGPIPQQFIIENVLKPSEGVVGGIPGISQPIRQISANTPANAMTAFNQTQPMSTQQLSFFPQQQLSFAPQQPLSQAPQGLAQFSSMLNRFS